MLFSAFRRSLDVERQGEGEYVDGIWQPGSPSNITIDASVQPTSPTDYEKLPEGRRERKAYTLYSASPLCQASEHDDKQPDRVTIDGEKYEVSRVEKWGNYILPHYKAVVTLMPEQDG